MTETVEPSELDRAFTVLDQAVLQCTHPGHVPRASQVRLAMKRLTYDGFDPSAFGYRRFRDFLDAAQSAGVVTLRDRPGDIEVLSTSPTATGAVQSRARVRRDLWRAFVNWDEEVLHYFDVENSRVAEIPRNPVPLEPPRFAQLRARIDEGDPGLLGIPSVPLEEQMRWMHRFTEAVGDASLRSLLVGALAGERPAKHFTSIVTADRAEQVRWNRFFGERVLAAVRAWQASHPALPESEVFEASTETDDENDSEVPGERAGGLTSSDATSTRDLIETASRLVESAQAARRLGTAHETNSAIPLTGATPGSSLRALVHRAVDRMSDDELRSLRLPVGALLDEV